MIEIFIIGTKIHKKNEIAKSFVGFFIKKFVFVTKGL